MILRFTAIVATVVCGIALCATPALAEHEENEHAAMPGVGEDEHGGAAHQVAFPTEAINWADFSYYTDEAEEQYGQYGVHEPGPPIVATLFNFLCLVLIIYLLARKPLMSFLQSRSDSVREGLAEAKKLLEEANDRLADYSARLERMDEEMTRLREEFIAAGESERDRLVAEAGAKAERMRRDAEVRLQQEFAQLKEELRVETIEKAVAAATDTLKAQVKDPDQRRLADEYLETVEREGLGR